MDEKKPYTIKYITKEQYEEIITKGSTVIDGETVSWGDNLSDKDSNDMFDETVIDTLKEMAVKHSNDSYVYRVFVNAINLIHRQKAEIELLKKRHGVALLRNDDLDLENYELKKQVEAWKARAKELEQSWEISSSNEVALQKQVDELKNYAERLFEENQDHYDKLQNANLYIENHEPIWKRNVEQAVKDTAKEILGLILAKEFEKDDYLTDDELKNLFAEKYGVEVE